MEEKLLGSIKIPSEDILCPRKSIKEKKNSHISDFQRLVGVIW
jgi:hypothetical protein